MIIGIDGLISNTIARTPLEGFCKLSPEKVAARHDYSLVKLAEMVWYSLTKLAIPNAI